MTEPLNDRVAAEIAVQLKSRFGLNVREAVAIDKGWLNIKWKIITDHKWLFVKYYHPDRYKLHTRPDKKRDIERTLELQNSLNEAGVPCPKVYGYKGQMLQETPSGLFYTVMDWVHGYTVQAGELNAAQMLELGAATGRMHRWLRTVPPLAQPAWRPDKEAYFTEWQVNWEQALAAGDRVVMDWLQRSQHIVSSMDFSIFELAPIGWLHWDLWVDNIVLHGQGVSGIVDFDRMTMAYPELDVARVVLSGALHNGQMNAATAQAFMKGYRQYSEAPAGMLTRAMRMLYLCESLWWLRTEVRAESELKELLRRFVEELHWIENNWSTLAEQMDLL